VLRYMGTAKNIGVHRESIDVQNLAKSQNVDLFVVLKLII
jgi:hypothetical protein